jgi:hypothetical protein
MIKVRCSNGLTVRNAPYISLIISFHSTWPRHLLSTSLLAFQLYCLHFPLYSTLPTILLSTISGCHSGVESSHGMSSEAPATTEFARTSKSTVFSYDRYRRTMKYVCTLSAHRQTRNAIYHMYRHALDGGADAAWQMPWKVLCCSKRSITLCSTARIFGCKKKHLLTCEMLTTWFGGGRDTINNLFEIIVEYVCDDRRDSSAMLVVQTRRCK